MKLEHLDARCFLCGADHGSFDTGHRRCECLGPLGFPASELSCYVTILPEPRNYSVGSLPSVWTRRPRDVYALAVDSYGSAAEAAERAASSGRTPGPEGGDGVLYPFPRDVLALEHHLRCGNTIIHRSSMLEDVTGFAQVHVVNMGFYAWSCTLKDPRSWAIINTALANGITDLAVWTAGNAGLSLAKLATIVNRRLPRERRLQVHAIVDSDVAPDIRTRLRLWQCEILDIFRRDKPVLNPEEVKGLVAARLKRSRRQLDEAAYWDVTDGWDGVGLLMYRYLAGQIIRDMGGTSTGAAGDARPFYVVLPVGTGDLLLGFYLGLRDCERAGLIPENGCRLVGALPSGASILHNIRSRTIPEPLLHGDGGDAVRVAAARGRPSSSAATEPSEPLMPKLRSTHTPLAPCLSLIDKQGSVHFTAVTGLDQLRAGRHVLSGGIDDGLACEPSALAAFAALPHVHATDRERDGSGRPWQYQSRSRVLVVNSGLGVLGREEEDLLHQASVSNGV